MPSIEPFEAITDLFGEESKTIEMQKYLMRNKHYKEQSMKKKLLEEVSKRIIIVIESQMK